MKKNLLALMLTALTASVFCQTTDQENHEKYWKYRDQLRKRYMKIGQFEGESIPASVTIPNTGQFILLYEGDESEAVLTLTDAYGKLVHLDQRPIQKNERRQIQLTQTIATGYYFLEFQTVQGVYRKQLIVTK